MTSDTWLAAKDNSDGMECDQVVSRLIKGHPATREFHLTLLIGRHGEGETMVTKHETRALLAPQQIISPELLHYLISVSEVSVTLEWVSWLDFFL